MADAASSAAKKDPFKKVSSHLSDMRVALNQIAPGLAYQIGNMHLLHELKQDVRYKNGMTIPPDAEKMFMAAALAELALTSNHSEVLAKNMRDANDAKPDGEVESHHIVATRARAARPSRLLLFGWSISINDKDNGVHLPAYKRSEVPSLPDAIKHRQLHTKVYHAQVFLRLDAAARLNAKDSAVGRDTLKMIKSRFFKEPSRTERRMLHERLGDYE
jgi:hypothetical protein